MTEEFIEKAQRHLGLEWADDATASVIADQAAEAEALMLRYDPNFSISNPEQAGLLITLMRYIRSGATHEFFENYKAEVLALSDFGQADLEKKDE